MTVVVGYVPKPEGDAALERAIAEAQLRNADLIVVNTSSGDAYADPTWATDQQLTTIQQRLQSAGVPHELVHTMGNDPATHVVQVADKAHATLLVIGLRRRSHVGKLLLGSTASTILMHAPCAVLAVKAADVGLTP